MKKWLLAVAGSVLLLSACAEGGLPSFSEQTDDTAPVESASSSENGSSAPAVTPQTSSGEVSTENILPEGFKAVKPATNPFNEDNESRIIPERLIIPSIGIDSPINPYGLDGDGNMEVPDNGEEVAWFEPGADPGQKGNAVLAGHVDSEKAPAVFWDLKDLEPGDEIFVEGEDGKVLTFAVQDKQVYDRNEAPIQEIFGTSSRKKLNLITCTGYFDRDVRNYVDRMVISTELTHINDEPV